MCNFYPIIRQSGGVLSLGLLCVILFVIFTPTRPPYGSMEECLVYCVSVCLFVCTVTDFSATEKARGVKFCMRVGLLSGQVFSLSVKIGSRGSHGGGNTSGMNDTMK